MIAPTMAVLLAASACSAIGGDDDDPGEGLASGQVSKRVVLVTHESFALPKGLQKKFEQETGYELETRASGDGGALTNKLVLTKENPLGDAAFGVDNTFASRALDEGVFAPYAAKLPQGADEFLLDGELDTVVAFVVEAGLVTGLYAIRNPAKLARLDAVVALTR